MAEPKGKFSQVATYLEERHPLLSPHSVQRRNYLEREGTALFNLPLAVARRGSARRNSKLFY